MKTDTDNLREQIDRIVQLVRQGGYNDRIHEDDNDDGHDLFSFQMDGDVAKEQLIHLIEQHALEARIDELRAIGSVGSIKPMSAISGEMGKWVSIEERIAELQATKPEKEEV